MALDHCRNDVTSVSPSLQWFAFKERIPISTLVLGIDVSYKQMDKDFLDIIC